jgi:hypothetical protein
MVEIKQFKWRYEMQQKTFKVTLKAKFEIDAKSMQEAQEILNTYIAK